MEVARWGRGWPARWCQLTKGGAPVCGTTGLFHVGITVRDLDRSLAFYRGALGLEVDWDQVIDRDSTRELVGVPFSRLRCAFLALPGGGALEILEYEGVTGRDLDWTPSDHGAGHLCLWVADLDVVVSRARELGGVTIAVAPVTVPGGRYEGARVVYLRDPDGFLLELIEPAPAAS